jgi:hypothetical protein
VVAGVAVDVVVPAVHDAHVIHIAARVVVVVGDGVAVARAAGFAAVGLAAVVRQRVLAGVLYKYIVSCVWVREKEKTPHISKSAKNRKTLAFKLEKKLRGLFFKGV